MVIAKTVSSLMRILKGHKEFSQLKRGVPLRELFAFADGLTAPRNAREFPSILHRAAHLAVGGGEILDVARVDDKRIVPVVAAKIVMRIINVSQGLLAHDELVGALIEKYPMHGCSYCRKKPCVCGIDKSKIFEKRVVTSEEISTQKKWSLDEWQQCAKEVYGKNNWDRGFEKAVMRLGGETPEVLQAVLMMGREKRDEEKLKLRKEIILELADVLAWTLAVCNVAGSSLETAPSLAVAFEKIYGNGCPNCKKYPCKCACHFGYMADRKNKRFLC